MSELTFLDHTRGDERSLCFYKIRIRIIDLSFKFCTIMILHYYLLRIRRRFWRIASYKQIADVGHLQQLHSKETVYSLRFQTILFGWDTSDKTSVSATRATLEELYFLTWRRGSSLTMRLPMLCSTLRCSGAHSWSRICRSCKGGP